MTGSSTQTLPLCLAAQVSWAPCRSVSRLLLHSLCPQGGKQGQELRCRASSYAGLVGIKGPPRLTVLLMVMPALQARQLPLLILVAPLQLCQLHAHLHFLCIQPVNGSLQGTHLCARVQEPECCTQASGCCGRQPRHAEEFPPVTALGSAHAQGYSHLQAWF